MKNKIGLDKDSYQGGKSTLIGGPPPEVAKDLERLWQELFRSNPQ